MPVARPIRRLLTLLALIMPATIPAGARGTDCGTRETAEEAPATVVFRHFV